MAQQVVVNVIERKNEIVNMLSSKEVAERVSNILEKDPKKVTSFKEALISMSMDPKLVGCSLSSIMKSSMNLAGLGLSLNKLKSEAYVVPYGKNAESMIGYKGWLKLAKESGLEVRVVEVFQSDLMPNDNGYIRFQCQYGSDGNPLVNYIPDLLNYHSENIEWYVKNLALIWVSIKDMATGSINNQFVKVGTLNKIMGSSKGSGGNSSPYTSWRSEMYKAKAIKYVLSKTPMSDSIADAIDIENQLDKKVFEDSQTSSVAPSASNDFFLNMVGGAKTQPSAHEGVEEVVLQEDENPLVDNNGEVQVTEQDKKDKEQKAPVIVEPIKER